MVAYTRTGFADEISEDLDEQLDVLEELGIGYMDLRGVWGTNVLDLDPDEVEDVRAALDERGIGVSAIGSPIGKVDIDDPFDPHFDRFETAIERAHQFDADYIRLFSYWMPEGEDPDDYREEVLGRMETKAERAAEADVVLIHENEKDIYGDTPARCRDILASVDSPHLRAVFDPANFLEVGVRPYPDGLLQLVEYVDFLHIKDAEFGQRGAIAPAGQGDGRIPETLEALAARGFEGFASLEPHLAQAGEYGGYSGPDAFHVACEALEDCFDEAGVDYE
jgi:sugar phosphate isomerase/epimerase